MTTPTTPKKPVKKALPVFFYKTAAGTDVVLNEIRSLSEDAQHAIGTDMNLLELHGLSAPKVDVKREPHGMLALRVHEGDYRVLFFIEAGEAWMLYVFQKDDEKLLKRHSDAARARMDDLKARFLKAKKAAEKAAHKKKSGG